MFKVNYKNIRKTFLASFWCFIDTKTLTYFICFSSVSVVDLKQVNDA